MLLEVKGIDCYYGLAHIIHRLSLNVCLGEVVCLLGRNGVGKSTTLNAIAGAGKAETRSGSIHFKGKEVTRFAPHRIARLGLGYVPEDRRVFSTLTVHENLIAGSKSSAGGQKPYWTIEKFYKMYPEMGEMHARLAGTLSGGQQQILSIGRTLMGNPDLIMIDEPTEGLAPLLKDRIFEMLKEIRATGASILLVDTSIYHVMKLVDRIYAISKGEIVFDGTVDEFQADDTIRREYLEV